MKKPGLNERDFSPGDVVSFRFIGWPERVKGRVVAVGLDGVNCQGGVVVEYLTRERLFSGQLHMIRKASRGPRQR